MSVVDLGTLLGCTVLILLSAVMFKKKQLDRIEGMILLMCEAAYMWYLISNL
jgi:Ca2+/Na+ antiporter